MEDKNVQKLLDMLFGMIDEAFSSGELETAMEEMGM